MIRVNLRKNTMATSDFDTATGKGIYVITVERGSKWTIPEHDYQVHRKRHGAVRGNIHSKQL